MLLKNEVISMVKSKKDLSKQFPYIVIVSIVAIVGIVILLVNGMGSKEGSSSNIVGEASMFPFAKPSLINFCEETDNVVDPQVEGSAKITSFGVTYKKRDFCYNPDWLSEAVCSNFNPLVDSVVVECNAGTCKNGKCIPLYVCGDGIVEGTEICDGNNLGAYTQCKGLGYPGGVYKGGSLSCTRYCRYNYNNCY